MLTNKMNKTLKETLELRGDAMSLYALKYIDGLEKQQLKDFAKFLYKKEYLVSVSVDEAVKEFEEFKKRK